MKRSKNPAKKKITDLTDKIEAYRASAFAAGSERDKSPARAGPGNLALASAAAGGAALAVAPAAEAAIQHINPPDIIVQAGPSASTYTSIDVDGDGDNDFVIRQVNGSAPFPLAYLHPSYLNSASVLAKYPFTGPPFPEPKALDSTYNIANITAPGPTFWFNGGSPYPALLGAGSIYGNFPGVEDKFIGVRFINNPGGGPGPLHYGWIQVNVAADSSSITIVDWAYEDTPNTPILAGAGAAPAVIPTLNEWGLIVLMTLLAGAAAWKMNRPEPLQA